MFMNMKLHPEATATIMNIPVMYPETPRKISSAK